MLTVEKLSYHYKGRPAVLQDVNFQAHASRLTSPEPAHR